MLELCLSIVVFAGDIVALNEEDMTIDVRIWDGYEATTKTSGRIEIFNKEGRMLPHGQDSIQVSNYTNWQRPARCALAWCIAAIITIMIVITILVIVMIIPV